MTFFKNEGSKLTTVKDPRYENGGFRLRRSSKIESPNGSKLSAAEPPRYENEGFCLRHSSKIEAPSYQQ